MKTDTTIRHLSDLRIVVDDILVYNSGVPGTPDFLPHYHSVVEAITPTGLYLKVGLRHSPMQVITECGSELPEVRLEAFKARIRKDLDDCIVRSHAVYQQDLGESNVH